MPVQQDDVGNHGPAGRSAGIGSEAWPPAASETSCGVSRTSGPSKRISRPLRQRTRSRASCARNRPLPIPDRLDLGEGERRLALAFRRPDDGPGEQRLPPFPVFKPRLVSLHRVFAGQQAQTSAVAEGKTSRTARPLPMGALLTEE